MGKIKKVALAGRAWRLLRLALLWVQKGGAFKRGLVFDLRLVPGYLKSLKPSGGHSYRLRHGEREFSFNETPAFHFKTPSMRLPRLPCINTPAVDFDNDDDYIFFKCEKKDEFFDRESRKECSMDSCEGGEDDDDVENDDDKGINCRELIEVEEEQEIDSKAEEFIARFYEEMKLQRQFSLLQYNEMLRRGMS